MSDSLVNGHLLSSIKTVNKYKALQTPCHTGKLRLASAALKHAQCDNNKLLFVLLPVLSLSATTTTVLTRATGQ